MSQGGRKMKNSGSPRMSEARDWADLQNKKRTSLRKVNN